MCVCVVSAVDDGNCSPWVMCNSSVLQESIRWKGDLWWLTGRRPKTGFVTVTFSVKFPQSVMIWGAMSSAGVGPLCFLKTNITAPVYQEILEHFMLSSADQLFKDADVIFQQDLAPTHTAKKYQKLDKWPWCWCACLASKLNKETKKCRWAEGHCQRNLGFHSSATNWSPPCHAQLRQ